MNDSTFRSHTIQWLIGVGSASFLLTILLVIFGQDFSSYRSAGSNSYSRSAIGHRAFVEFLRRHGSGVVVSRHRSAVRAAGLGTFIVVAPRISGPESDEGVALDEFWLQSHRMLLVLPKWEGISDPERPRWVGAIQLVDDSLVVTPLQTIGFDASLVRLNRNSKVEWSVNSYPSMPSLDSPQLVNSDELQPLIACEQGTLLGESSWGDDRLFVLSDPDLLSNHGIGKGDNAQLLLEILQDLRDGDGPIVVDETIHGFAVAANVWRELFRPPLLFVLIQVLMTTVALLWSAMLRFGPVQAALPPFQQGKAYLIQNTAQLLHDSRHRRFLPQRYFWRTMDDLHRRLHGPAGLNQNEILNWLNRVGQSRGAHLDIKRTAVTTELLAEHRNANPVELLEVARDIDLWRRELLHESR